jgi:hypothetical protein
LTGAAAQARVKNTTPRTLGADPTIEGEAAMAIVVHIVNTPKTDARTAYEASWRQIDEQGLRHPKGRQTHTAWLVGDALHVVDVWDSADHMNDWMQTLAPILQAAEMELAGPPETGELLQVVQPD